MSCTGLVFVFLLSPCFFLLSLGDIGNAATYAPPYAPTACYGNDASQLPSSNLFAAAGEGIWDNGAACGRQYKVRCLLSFPPGTCIPNKTIQIEIVDRAHTSDSKPTMVLTTIAFGSIANGSTASINVEFQRCETPQQTNGNTEASARPKQVYSVRPKKVSGNKKPDIIPGKNPPQNNGNTEASVSGDDKRKVKGDDEKAV